MNTLSFIAVLFGQGVFMALLSFAIVYGMAAMLGIEDSVDIRIGFTFFVVSCMALYGSSFGVFAGVQKSNCGEVKNWKQIAMNATLPTLIQVVLLAMVFFIPWFQNVVGDMLPPDSPAFGKTAAALAYYTFWATLLGGALGGTMSGSCKVDPTLPELPEMPEMPEMETLKPLDVEKSVRFNLPPE
jgi:hypothetical protein